jgi:hypothetical protein
VAENSSSNAIGLAITGWAATGVAIVSQPSHGAVSVSGTQITYTPTTGYTGSDSFTYEAQNGAFSSPATVSLTVSSTLPAPPTGA